MTVVELLQQQLEAEGNMHEHCVCAGYVSGNIELHRSGHSPVSVMNDPPLFPLSLYSSPLLPYP